jgi:hypothetical protein
MRAAVSASFNWSACGGTALRSCTTTAKSAHRLELCHDQLRVELVLHDAGQYFGELLTERLTQPGAADRHVAVRLRTESPPPRHRCSASIWRSHTGRMSSC